MSAGERRFVDIVFSGVSGDPGKGPEFVEVEDESGASIRLGEWIDRDDGMRVLRIPGPKEAEALGWIAKGVVEAVEDGGQEIAAINRKRLPGVYEVPIYPRAPMEPTQGEREKVEWVLDRIIDEYGRQTTDELDRQVLLEALGCANFFATPPSGEMERDRETDHG